MNTLPTSINDDSIQEIYNSAENISALSYDQGLEWGNALKKSCEDPDDHTKLIELMGQIGASWCLEILKAYMASDDEEIKHTVIFSFLEYSRADAVPVLLDNFRTEENEDLREDTRVVLIAILGKKIGTLFHFANPQGEYEKINEFWKVNKHHFVDKLCYSDGELVELEIWVNKLETASDSFKAMLNERLFIWTGNRIPEDKNLANNWKQWLITKSGAYEKGKRYFMGYLIR